jgi:hypothetical protein
MKLMWLSFGFLVLAASSGCVQRHRSQEAAHSTAPAPVVTVPPPTSERSEPRVYPVTADEPVEPPSAPPSDVSNRDLALAESISKLLNNDPHLASISGNVQTTVDQGVVILRGTVPSGNAMDEIALRISKLPGVAHLREHLTVGNR